MSLSNQARAQLINLCIENSTYEVVKALTEHVEHVSEITYGSNSNAIVHRDAAILRRAVTEMMSNKPDVRK